MDPLPFSFGSPMWKRSLPLALTLCLASTVLPAQRVDDGPASEWASKAKVDILLRPTVDIEPIEAVTLGPEQEDDWVSFRQAQIARGDWRAYIDRRSGLVEVAEGAGIPWIPGRGNRLTLADLGARLGGQQDVDLTTLESLARDFIAQHGDLLGTAGRELRVATAASGPLSDYLWNVEFEVWQDGLRIEDARVFFRVNHGNLVQWGARLVPAPNTSFASVELDEIDAREQGSEYLGGFVEGRDFQHGKSQLYLIPTRTSADERGDYVDGQGYGLRPVWEYHIARAGDQAVWRLRVDATTGEVLEMRDTREFSQVRGGYWPISWRVGGVVQPQVTVGWPFANVTPLGVATNSSGVYTWDSNAQTARHIGPYVSVNDNCAGGPGSAPSDGVGDIDFSSAPTAPNDCANQLGINDNTAAARQQFVHVNKIAEKARSYYPATAWLSSQLPVNVNINDSCNAFWNGASLNFYTSGTVGSLTCGNTGEDVGIAMHEWGHGFDSNDGSAATAENGTGETYGDFTAALQTLDSCVGWGFFFSGGACGGYGDPCVSHPTAAAPCDGVRDIDWGNHANNRPWTVDWFTDNICPCSNSPACNGSYNGPCGFNIPNGADNKEGHCESYVSSGALFDFAAYDLQTGCSGRNGTYPDWNCPGAGGPYGAGAAWSITDRLWYLSRSQANQAFTCNTGGATWTSNGCNSGSNWRTMRFVDDDDGNLANGTPHSCQLAAAFDRHEIACTSDAMWNVCNQACTPPAAPTLAGSGSNNSVALSWTPNPGADLIDIYRNDIGCNAGFTRIANDASGTGYNDTAVANGTTYYYQIVRHPVGSESCGSVPSSCISVTPNAGPSAIYVNDSATLNLVLGDGDSDGILDNCETGRVGFSVVNNGVGSLSNVVATIATADPAVTVTTPMPIAMAASLAETVQAASTFDFNLSGATCGHQPSFSIAVTADEMQAQMPPLTTQSGFSLGATEQDLAAMPTPNSFEVDEEQWTLASGFTRDNSQASLGSWSIHSTSGIDNTCDVAQSPFFVPQAGSPSVTLAVRYDIEDPASGPWDKGNVHAVHIGSGTHTLLTPTGETYDSVGASQASLCHITNDAGWTGADLTWGDAVFDLSGLSTGESYYLEVNYNTDPAATGTGLWFDNVRWTDVQTTVCDVQSDSCVCNNPDLAGAVGLVDLDACDVGIQVSWTDVSDWGDGAPTGTIEVFRSVDGISWTSAGVDPDGVSPFVDTGATPGQPYHYRVLATNGCLATAEIVSSPTTITDVANGPVFGGIQSATDVDSCRETGVALSWNAPSNWQNPCAGNDCTFTIYRGATPIATLPMTTLSYTDAGGAPGVAETYHVRANNPTCSAGSTITLPGTDVVNPVPPTFGGVTFAGALGTECKARVEWNPASSSCGGTPVYNVYRTDDGSAPDAGDLYQTCVTNLFYEDTNVTGGTTYRYMVRAEDSLLGGGGACADGFEESNTTDLSALPSAGGGVQTLYENNFDAATPPTIDDWVLGSFYQPPPAIQPTSWLGVQTCTANSGTNIFRFGGTACTDDYNTDQYYFAQPAGTTGISVPPGATTTRLEFEHRRQFETNWDGAAVAVSLDGSSYTFVPPSMIISGTTYNGNLTQWAGCSVTLGPNGLPIFTGTDTSFTPTEVDLDAVCDAIDAGSDGCQGEDLRIAFTTIADCTVTADGWFLDDVVVTADVPGAACTNDPAQLPAFTALSTDQQVKLEWQNPLDCDLGGSLNGPVNVVVRWDPASFPTSHTGGNAGTTTACVDGSYGTWTHGGLTNDDDYFYSAFLVDADGNSSARRVVEALPFDNTAETKWAYATAASATSGPGIGSVYVASNDRTLHSMNPGTGGGDWPGPAPQWQPLTMGAPSQGRPTILPLPAPGPGGATKIALLGSQDQRVYAVNAETGQQIWASPDLGGMIQGSPTAMLTVYGGAFDLVFAGTRNAGGASAVHALNLNDGSIAWTFDNGGGASAIGIISGAAWVDYANTRLYFTSRRRAGGSPNTLWAINFTGASAASHWSVDAGEIDGNVSLWNGRVYIGNNEGGVQGRDEANGALLWNFDTGDGPVKNGMVIDRPGQRLFFSTTNRVWGLGFAGDTDTLLWSTTAVPGPSSPVLPPGAFLYVGANNGRFYEVDLATGGSTSVQLGDGTAVIGRPSFDGTTLYAGSDSGAVYSVTPPL